MFITCHRVTRNGDTLEILSTLGFYLESLFYSSATTIQFPTIESKMAPTNKDSSSTNTDDKSRMLKEAFKCVNGTLDFDKLAVTMGVPNGEAM